MVRSKDVVMQGLALCAYVALLMLANLISVRVGPGLWAQSLPALLPIGGAVLCLLAFLRIMRQLDEFQRRIQLEGLAFGFAATGLLTFSWGFFEDAGAARLPTFWILPIMAVLWVLGVLLANWRFR